MSTPHKLLTACEIGLSAANRLIYYLCVKIPDQVISKKLQSEEVLLELRSGTYYGLNDTGTYIFDQIKKGSSAATIANALVTEYEIEPEQAKRDVEAFLAELKSESLLCGDS